MSANNNYIFDHSELEWRDIVVDQRPWIHVHYYNEAITGLHVMSVFGADDINEIIKWCPNLRRLTMAKMSFSIFQSPLVKDAMKNLKVLKIQSFSDRLSQQRKTSARRIVEILEACSKLEELHLPGALSSEVFLQARYISLRSISLEIDTADYFVTRFFRKNQKLERAVLSGTAATIVPLLPVQTMKMLTLKNCSCAWTPSFGHLKELISLRIENISEWRQLYPVPFDDSNLIDVSAIPNLKSFFYFNGPSYITLYGVISLAKQNQPAHVVIEGFVQKVPPNKTWFDRDVDRDGMHMRFNDLCIEARINICCSCRTPCGEYIFWHFVPELPNVAPVINKLVEQLKWFSAKLWW